MVIELPSDPSASAYLTVDRQVAEHLTRHNISFGAYVPTPGQLPYPPQRSAFTLFYKSKKPLTKSPSGHVNYRKAQTDDWSRQTFNQPYYNKLTNVINGCNNPHMIILAPRYLNLVGPLPFTLLPPEHTRPNWALQPHCQHRCLPWIVLDIDWATIRTVEDGFTSECFENCTTEAPTQAPLASGCMRVGWSPVFPPAEVDVDLDIVASLHESLIVSISIT